MERCRGLCFIVDFCVRRNAFPAFYGSILRMLRGISHVLVMQANQNFLFYDLDAWIGRVCYG